MQIEEILDDLPTTPEEFTGMVVGLLESIERFNRAIERHLSYPERDNLAIEGFTHRREHTEYYSKKALFRAFLLFRQPTYLLTPKFITKQGY